LKKLFSVAGEISGDTHGAALITALPGETSAWELAGLGGPKMHSLAPEIENWLDDAAVLGLWEVLKKISWFKRKLNKTAGEILEFAPDGVLLIDYPGFNLRLAKRLRSEGYTGKLLYYISPQVWAWKKGRIRQMTRLLDLMICIFPFEKELYGTSGLKTVFAGHPLVDSLAQLQAAPPEREKQLIALLPGSREREVAVLFPPMLEAARILLESNPEYRFATSGATPILNDRLRAMVEQAGLSGKVDVREHNSHEIMQRAVFGIVASGTATLEAACLGLPYCLVYKVSWQTALVARWFMSVDFLGIVNVMANKEIVTELLQENVSGPSIDAEISRWMEHPDQRSHLQRELSEITKKLGGGEARVKAAAAVASALEHPVTD